MAATFATFMPARAAAEDMRVSSTSARRPAPAAADILPIYVDSYSIRLGRQGTAQHTAEGSARATTRAAQLAQAAAAAKPSKQLADPADVTAKLWRSNWDLVTEAAVPAPGPAPEPVATAPPAPRQASTSYRPRRSSSLAASLARTAPPADVPAPATEPEEPVTPPARQSSSKPDSQPLFVSPDIAAFADFEPGSQRGTHRDRVRQASPALEASMKSTSQSYFITGGAGSAWHVPEVGLSSTPAGATAGVVPGAMLSERLDDATSFSRSSSLYRATGVVQVHVDNESATPAPPQPPEAAEEAPARPRLQSLWASRPALAASISEDQDQRAALARKPATVAPGTAGGEAGTSVDAAARGTSSQSDPATHAPRISNPGATLAEYGRSRLQSLPDISEHDVSDSEQSSAGSSPAQAPTPSPAPAMPSRGPALLVRTGAASSVVSAESQTESDVPVRHGRTNSVPRDVEQHQRTAPASQPPPRVSVATQRDQAGEPGSARRRSSSAAGSAFEPGDSTASPMLVPSQAPAVPSTCSSVVQLQEDATAQPQAAPQESGGTSGRPPDRPPTPPKPRPSLALPIASTPSTADDSHFPPADPHGHSPEWKHVRLRHIGRPLTPQACPTPLQSRGSVASRMFPPEANLPPPAA